MNSRIVPVFAVFCALIVSLLSADAVADETGAGGLGASPLSHYSMLFDTLLGQHYAEADSVVRELRLQYPEHPAVDYAEASVIYAKITDLEDTAGTADLESLVEACLSKCDDWADRAKDSLAAEREYLRGAAYSISGLTRHRQGRVVDGVRRVMASRRHFERVIELDPEFYDAYVGRGVYRYAAAQNLSMFRWLPGVPTKRQGWEDLTIGLERAKFSRFAALSSMVWLVLDEENYTLADSMVKAGLERFPGSRTFLMPKLALEKRTENWAAARATAQKLLDQYTHLEFQNGYEVIGLYRTMMECSDKLGEPAAALSFARAGIAAAATPYALERRKDTLAALRERLDREDAR